MSKYYALTGNGQKSAAFTDSVIIDFKNYMTKNNISDVFHAEMKVNNAEKQAQEHQLTAERMEKEKYRNTLLFGLAIIFLSAVFYFLYVRLGKNKNRALYRQIREQDRLLRPSGNSQYQELVADMRNYLLEDRVFLTSVDQDKLFDTLKTNRTYLYKAVRAVTGKTLQEYVNAMRLEEARRMLDANPDLTVEFVAGSCGFSIRTFYRFFRENYNISPKEYRKLAKE